MKKWGLIGLLLGFFVFLAVLSLKHTQKKPKNLSYFESVPVSYFSQNPCINLEIEGKKLIAKLDLGYSGQISTSNEFANELKEKSFIKNEIYYSWRGKRHTEKLYEIPKIKINNISFNHIDLNEEDDSFHKESEITQKNTPRLDISEGKVGWILFKNSNLFLDLGNSRIIICNSVDTFKSHGFEMNAFTKVPFISKKGIIEIEAQTSNGTLLCFLDTGSTLNLINIEMKSNKSTEEVFLNPEDFTTVSSFQIDGKEFGPITFHGLPMKFPIHIEATLGMEFFREHQVFLDFANGYAYIAKCKKD